MNPLQLLDCDEMPRIPGLPTPEAFYTVLRRPALLAGMRHPTAATPWRALAEIGLTHVICLTTDRPEYDPSPLRFAHAVELEDLIGGRRPNDARREAARIAAAASVCFEVLRRGEGVVVHCEGGTGRTGTVLGAVLCRFGMTPETVAGYLDAIDRRRGTGWPESPWQADLLSQLVGV